jgi:hypothetical protein
MLNCNFKFKHWKGKIKICEIKYKRLSKSMIVESNCNKIERYPLQYIVNCKIKKSWETIKV